MPGAGLFNNLLLLSLPGFRLHVVKNGMTERSTSTRNKLQRTFMCRALKAVSDLLALGNDQETYPFGEKWERETNPCVPYIGLSLLLCLIYLRVSHCATEAGKS